MKRTIYILVLQIYLTLPFWLQAQGLIIPSGGYVIANNGNIVVSKNWTNNGSFTHNGGTVIFTGTTQSLGGSTATTFNNLTTLTGSTTTITSPGHQLKNVLLSNGTFSANGNLTLLSNASQTAAIDGIGTGSVLGNLIIQRYIASGLGYKYFSSPFQNDTVGDFSNDLDLTASFPTFYRHDENQASNGWVNYTNGAGVLNPLQGYAANLGSSTNPKTVDLVGVVNNNSVSINLYNHNQVYTQGFNLVGNPFPSPINWDASSGWTKTNIDNAVYYFNAGSTNQYTGVYSSYINGVSSDGVAGSTIPAMQGFFVHVSNGTFPVSGQLIINNNARMLNTVAHFFGVGGQQDQRALLRLTAGLAEQKGLSDPVVIYFNETGAGSFDKRLDALKLMNTDSLIPNLYAVSTDAQKLSIQALNISNDSLTVVPLGLTIKKDGFVTINATDIIGMPANLPIYLTDIKTGVNHDLRIDPMYQLYLPSGIYENRFFLKFGTKELVGLNPPGNKECKVYSSGGRLFVNANLPSGEIANVTVINMLGQVICRTEISGNVFQPVAAVFPKGIYVVHFSGLNKKQTKKVFIGER